MGGTAIAALPTSSNPGEWSDEEKALVEAAGLVHTDARSGQRTLADRPVVAAFLQHCARTGLDPIARQIYCLARRSKGQLKWQIQISIDGARLVAERTRQYEGQTPVQWTADGVTWTDVWLADGYPAAARVGVFRAGFREPLFAVARWSSYAVFEDVWEGGKKTDQQKVSSMWAKMPDLMLGKVAEMLALRKAFPQDLSGLYSSEEMQQAGAPAVEAPAPSVARPVVAEPQQPIVAQGVVSRDWAALAEACVSMDALRALKDQAEEAGELGLTVGLAGDNDDGSARTVGQVLWDRRAVLLAKPVAPEPESKPVRLDAPAEPISWAVAPIPGAEAPEGSVGPSDEDAPSEDYSAMDEIAEAGRG